MGLTRQYLRYVPAGFFGVVGTARAGLLCLELHSTKGHYVATGACENVIVWNLRKGEQVVTLHGDKHEVTSLAGSPDKCHLAAGYNDGTVRVFDLATGDCTITFSGHKSAVSALNYDHNGMRLVSGGMDTDVIVWDIVNESGLYRLKGHKGLVSQARFLSKQNILITSSKDTLVKFWDLDTQHCFRTLVGHRTEVWDFVVAKEETRLITGSADNEMRVWELSEQSSREGPESKRPRLEGVEETHLGRADEEETDEDEELEEEAGKSEAVLTCRRLGSVLRQGKGRTMTLNLDPTGRVLGCHGTDSMLELFTIQSDEEMQSKLQKRQKKARKRARDSEATPEEVKLSLQDEILRKTSVKLSSKLRSFGCHLEGANEAKVLALLTNNQVQQCSVDLSQKKPEKASGSRLMLPGHRSDVRTLCFSSDNTALLSASAEELKVWNRDTLKCIRTMKCDYALCSLFVPGDRHVVIGTKSGKLQIFDLAASEMLESVEAHTDSVWAVALAPNKKGLISGGADKEVKFWDFELISDEEYSTTSKRLSLVHTRTLKMTDGVLCVKYSSDGKFVAVSLLDNTVKVFFADTLKFFLSLYGHKLPVLCMDISTDGTLIATGSADRNVKIWGLDFGDCHKSIFAHDDSIMCLQFVYKTHMFFTGGKDGKVKEWDADNFQQIITLEAHHAEVWCLAVSPSGNFMVSGSHDKSLRMWERTQEPVILDEEKEMEREKEHEESLAQGDETVIAGETNKEAVLAGKKTVETIRGAERLMEALNVCDTESAKLQEHEDQCKALGKELPAPSLNPLIQAYGASTPQRYVLEILKKIKSSELEEALLVLPFDFVLRVLKMLHYFLEHAWEVELCCRCLFFLLRIHQGRITSTQVLLPTLDKLRNITQQRVTELRDTIGFNLAGLKFMKQQLEEKESVTFFADATDKFKEKKKKQKKRAILSVKV